MISWTESLVWLSGAISVLVAFILIQDLRRARVENRILHLRGDLPKADEIKSGLSAERRRQFPKLDHLAAVLDIVEPKAKAGILQEDAVMSALESRILHRVNWFRELSSTSILAALVFTFFKLHQDLPGILSKQELRGGDLAPIVPLVGANWPLIGLGLVFYLAAVFQERIAWYRLEAYQAWLEAEIFSYLGASRSTSDQLSVALNQFTATTAAMNRSLAPLQQLGIALSDFQTGLVNELVPAIKDGLQHVSVGLTDTALSKLTASTEASAHIMRAVHDHQARMLTVLMATERRTGDLASVVEAVAQHAQSIAAGLSKHSPVLEANTFAVSALGETVRESTDRLGTNSAKLESNLQKLDESVNRQSGRVDALGQLLGGLATLIANANSTMNEIGDLAKLVAGNLSALDSTVTQFGPQVAALTDPIAMTAKALPEFTAKAADLQDRWQEAMFQMTALADEVNRRTTKMEEFTRELTKALGAITSIAGGIDDKIGGVLKMGESLSQSASRISDGGQQLVAAFGDLQVVGQKIKNLGHGVTGHFAVWQKETKEVFRKAQDASAIIEGSLGRMSSVFGGLEAAIVDSGALIRELSEVKKGMFVQQVAERQAILPLDDGEVFPPLPGAASDLVPSGQGFAAVRNDGEGLGKSESVGGE